MLRDYLRLIRLPNIFTAPSNVFVGYFALTSDKVPDGAVLGGLAISSALLYVSGVVLNDYFDFETDRKERPDRPLPSGKVSKKAAALIAFAAIASANIIVALVGGLTALAVSLALTTLIIAYDYRLKSHPVAGPATMAGSRALNVLLGSSPFIAILLQGFFAFSGAGTLALAMGSVFCYILAVMAFSRAEVDGVNKRRYTAVFVGLVGLLVAIGLFGFLIGLQLWFLMMLAILALAIAFTFRKYRPKNETAGPRMVQFTIRNMVLCVILLDSVFVAGAGGLTYGLATLVLLIPAIVFARRLYVT
jgi:4-hydroxybenzoate polyprenyltransferase